ncbi:MAG: response regulator [Mangrovibacterium sp.]
MNRILIVDDNPKNIQLIANILKDFDFEIEYGQDGEEAIEIVKSQKFDLILMDVMMPQKDGFEACIDIKKIDINAKTPLIFITAKTEEEHITKGFKAGCVDYITKPFNAAELLSRIETHITLKKSKDKLKELNIALEGSLKETHKNLAATQQKLEEITANIGNLDSAKSEFLQIISHEIRTPLNGIIGLLEVFKEMMDSKEEYEFFDLFNASCKRLEKFSLLSLEISLLKTKGKDALKLEPTRFKQHLARCTESVQQKLTQKRLELSISCEDVLIFADVNFFSKTLSIIINNVIKHSSENRNILVTGQQKGGVYAITIQDEGPGLPKSIVNYGPTPFANEKYIDENPGLELYFCKLAIEAHGGTIFFTNNQHGAKIEMKIPIT